MQFIHDWKEKSICDSEYPSHADTTASKKASAIANIPAMQIPPHLQKASATANIPVLQILQHQKNITEVIFTTLQTHAMIIMDPIVWTHQTDN